jgi:hypothetical protein
MTRTLETGLLQLFDNVCFGLAQPVASGDSGFSPHVTRPNKMGASVPKADIPNPTHLVNLSS